MDFIAQIPLTESEGSFISADSTQQVENGLVIALPGYPHALAIARFEYVHLLRSPSDWSEGDEIDLERWISIASEIAHPGELPVGTPCTPASAAQWANEKIGEELVCYFDRTLRQDWNWEGIVEDAKENTEPGEEGDLVGREYLGTIMTLAPSGKFYTAWANSNMSTLEANVDACWYEALEAIADEYGGSIVSGEGDPCDLFFEIAVDSEDEDVDPVEVVEAIEGFAEAAEIVGPTIRRFFTGDINLHLLFGGRG